MAVYTSNSTFALIGALIPYTIAAFLLYGCVAAVNTGCDAWEENRPPPTVWCEVEDGWTITAEGDERCKS